VKTAITELFGIQHPIIQGGMSLILDHVRLAPSVKRED
jgi:NAD(P)H-dependent flavin oxidoreductase YrpB (nitropropane dioxygenase family)